MASCLWRIARAELCLNVARGMQQPHQRNAVGQRLVKNHVALERKAAHTRRQLTAGPPQPGLPSQPLQCGVEPVDEGIGRGQVVLGNVVSQASTMSAAARGCRRMRGMCPF